ncbi:MAG: aminoglycoside phosphotransferase family protein [Gammaproteobacteria bacterium]|nr:aminoglycoside phosphotransferase family protein [Gammaproteobacteria bacterium]
MADSARPVSQDARRASLAWFPRCEIRPLGAGFINDTFLIENHERRYVLQRINGSVFPDPHMAMSQTIRVVDHIAAKQPGWVPTLVPDLAGEFLHEDTGGEVWRLWDYVEGTETRQFLRGAAALRSAAQSFARFQNLLIDLPGPRFEDPIPGFMQLGHYLEDLAEMAPDEPWMRFVASRDALSELFNERTGYIHGDCKVNNLLYHVGGDEVAAVVDLDTVMYGHWVWDFGDLVRSAAGEAGAFSLDRYEVLLEGFSRETRRAPTVDELVLGPRYVTLMLGVRLLTDHLMGDRYFKVDSAGDNLRRAETQFRLLESMEKAETGMRERVKRYSAQD